MDTSWPQVLRCKLSKFEFATRQFKLRLMHIQLQLGFRVDIAEVCIETRGCIYNSSYSSNMTILNSRDDGSSFSFLSRKEMVDPIHQPRVLIMVMVPFPPVLILVRLTTALPDRPRP